MNKMSNFSRVSWNPKERVARVAAYMDNYFGGHQYGVMFDGDDQVYRPEETEIPIDLILVPAKALSSLLAENARLKQALEPFAREADAWDETMLGDDAEFVLENADTEQADFMLGDFRRARSALHGDPQ